MNILKKVLLGLGLLIVLLLVVALFVNKEITVERSIAINKPKEEVFHYVKYLKNQDNFSKWASMDPNMKKQYTGTDGKAGFVSAWSSEQSDVGKGEQKITGITEGERIDYALHFIEPFESKAVAYMTTSAPNPNQTNVTWGINTEMNYPMNLMLLFMDMDQMLGSDLETGLTNLKTVLEKQ